MTVFGHAVSDLLDYVSTLPPADPLPELGSINLQDLLRPANRPTE
jgi:hypothetical protein